MGAVFRGWGGRRGVPVLGPVAAWSSVAATHGRAHAPSFVVWRGRPVTFIVIVSVVATVWSSWGGEKRGRKPSGAKKRQEGKTVQRVCYPGGCCTGWPFTVFSRMVSKERRLPLPLVRVATWLTCQKDTAVKEEQEQHGACFSGAGLDAGRPPVDPLSYASLGTRAGSRHCETRALESQLLWPSFSRTTLTPSHPELGRDRAALQGGACSDLTRSKSPDPTFFSWPTSH